jgi:hypothetical protein
LSGMSYCASARRWVGPRRDSRQQNGITLRSLSQPTFATKSASNGHDRTPARCANCRYGLRQQRPSQAMKGHLRPRIWASASFRIRQMWHRRWPSAYHRLPC